jgi:DNA-binding YbaB/EbfC family protein
MNLGKFGKQFEDMQKKLQRVELDLKERVVEATAGGGMVKVMVNGAEEIVNIKIEKDVINPDDKGMLEDLVLAAVNEGVKKAKKLRETELAKVTGMVLPGLM